MNIELTETEVRQLALYCQHNMAFYEDRIEDIKEYRATLTPKELERIEDCQKHRGVAQRLYGKLWHAIGKDREFTYGDAH